MDAIEYRHLADGEPFPHLAVYGPRRNCYPPGTTEMRVRDPWLTPNLIRNIMWAASADHDGAPMRAVVWYRGPSFKQLTHVAVLVLPPGFRLETVRQRPTCYKKKIAA